MNKAIIFLTLITGLASAKDRVGKSEIIGKDINTVTCSSKNWMRKECKADTSAGVSLKKHLSRLTCKGNWGYTHNKIWVAKGCRAIFELSGDSNESIYPPQNSNFTCSSKNSRRASCPIATGSKVILTKQISSKSCENKWGQTRRQVWVIQGCQAEFIVKNKH